MAKYVIEDTTLNNTADAIREKTGKTDKITPSNFATEIASIESGSKVTKGIIINEFNSNEYPTDVSIVGMTQIPSGYFYRGTAPAGSLIFSKLIKVNLSDETTEILSYAFGKCKNLAEITTEGMITKIGDQCFTECTSFEKIVLPNVISVPTLGVSVFYETLIESGTGYIYVPDTLVDSFKSATNWSAYADQIKPISELEVSS